MRLLLLNSMSLVILLFLLSNSKIFAQDQQSVATLQKVLAIQQAQIARLEAKLKDLTMKDDAIYFKGAPLANYNKDENTVVWQGNPSGLKGEKGDSGSPGTNGANGTDGRNGTDGQNGTDGRNGTDGTSVCGKTIKIRTGVADPRGTTWLSLGYGVATTDARSNWANTVNVLECI